MKKLNKFFLVMLASLAVSFVSTSFVACSDDDDDDGPSTVATFKNESATADEYDTVTFYSDKTWKLHAYSKETEGGFTFITDLDGAIGTYTGDPSKDGDVVLKETKEADIDKTALLKKITEAASSGKTSITFTNSDFPLKDHAEEMTITISNGKTTVDKETFVKQ